MNENCCLCKFFTELYFFYWFLVVFLAILIACLCRLFSSFTNSACRSTLKHVARIKRFIRVHIVITETIKSQKLIIINSLLCWSVTLLKFIQTLDQTDSSHYRNENRMAVWVILEIFWTLVSLKAHAWSSWNLCPRPNLLWSWMWSKMFAIFWVYI